MTEPPRFFVSTETLRSDEVALADEAYHHLCHVLRARAGDLVLLLDGQGLCCRATLVAVRRQEALLEITGRRQEKEQNLPVTLIQALPKSDKFDLVLQKGTELGVQCFQPIETAHSIPLRSAKQRGKREERWQRIVMEAARQCRRTSLPVVRPVKTLAEVLTDRDSNLKLMLWESGAVPLEKVLPDIPPSGVSLLVGPEGGFSSAEIELARAAGFQAVHLGPRILRTETAGLAATPILQYLYGDWHQAPTFSRTNQHEESS